MDYVISTIRPMLLVDMNAITCAARRHENDHVANATDGAFEVDDAVHARATSTDDKRPERVVRVLARPCSAVGGDEMLCRPCF